jgi:hypothetical protein
MNTALIKAPNDKQNRPGLFVGKTSRVNPTKSRYYGVSFSGGRWIAQINHKGFRWWGGRFKTELEAYLKVIEELKRRGLSADEILYMNNPER